MITPRKFAYRDGKVVEIDHPRKVSNFNNPWSSHDAVSLGVLPSQKAEAEAESVALGVPTEFKRTKYDCVPDFKSRSHWKKYCQASGFFAKNASYGDPQPK